ncbi:response regulator transcription factor [Magnetospirillum gryphiswaldense]|uniref:DNA-binding response regulator in two-component regulatory system with EnvZ n=2 Tax=Magnetospirillum gryphiswaldense TaxID=55518 RepID=V6F3G2_MAGGM|nr:response regulator transcription factor [Magnetospirillum gryphiswaldense]AVM74012.1 TorCAD operon transcriptional regulatory protein TorR [Magnetospirillum gryphiswaldense MSR-1]AVM77915.1 TorCAD operon transcriptional regulatory protein TorR [Magnetospirillum gryphiswaldense]CAM74616.1 Response regulators consisting of a CheY-like receiver domain and a winged-helix DNA-binding domain [Magnetospirillum gryphiswaldense MSR-1]CDK98801.1 putative DNA-binding response regulator in two-component
MGDSLTLAMTQSRQDIRPKLVVLDDDPVTRSMIARYFSDEGFHVREAPSAAECRTLLKASPPDLLFVDIHLPDANGITFAQEIRASSQVGIIFVTQRDSEIDRVVGLESAGDDYVTKPINLRELMARTRSLLRRSKQSSGQPSHRSVITFGAYVMDMTRRELSSKGGKLIPLTRGEFDLLAALVEANGRPLYRDFLAEVVNNRTGGGEGALRTVDTLVARLRRKLKQAEGDETLIITMPGIGYRFGRVVGLT